MIGVLTGPLLSSLRPLPSTLLLSSSFPPSLFAFSTAISQDSCFPGKLHSYHPQILVSFQLGWDQRAAGEEAAGDMTGEKTAY